MAKEYGRLFEAYDKADEAVNLLVEVAEGTKKQDDVLEWLKKKYPDKLASKEAVEQK
jgi:hypothetical protein